MPPAAAAAGVGGGTALLGIGGAAIAGANKVGNNNFQPTNFQNTSDYNPNAYNYGGTPGGAAAAAGAATSNQQQQTNLQNQLNAQAQGQFNQGNVAAQSAQGSLGSAQNELGMSDADRAAQTQGLNMLSQRAQGQNLVSTQIADQNRDQLLAQGQSGIASARGPAAMALAQQQGQASTAQGLAQIGANEQIAGSQEELGNMQAYNQAAQGLRSADLSGVGAATGITGAATGLAGANYGASAANENAGIGAANVGLGYGGLANNIQTAQMQGQMAQQGMEAQQFSNGQQLGAQVSAGNAANSWKPWEMALGGAQGGAQAGTAAYGAVSGGGAASGGGGKAKGGEVGNDMPYLVGEKGPELVLPKKDGFVLTALQTAALRGAPPTPEQKRDLARSDHARAFGGQMGTDSALTGVDPYSSQGSQMGAWEANIEKGTGVEDDPRPQTATPLGGTGSLGSVLSGMLAEGGVMEYPSRPIDVDGLSQEKNPINRFVAKPKPKETGMKPFGPYPESRRREAGGGLAKFRNPALAAKLSGDMNRPGMTSSVPLDELPGVAELHMTPEGRASYEMPSQAQAADVSEGARPSLAGPVPQYRAPRTPTQNAEQQAQRKMTPEELSAWADQELEKIRGQTRQAADTPSAVQPALDRAGGAAPAPWLSQYMQDQGQAREEGGGIDFKPRDMTQDHYAKPETRYPNVVDTHRRGLVTSSAYGKAPGNYAKVPPPADLATPASVSQETPAEAAKPASAREDGGDMEAHPLVRAIYDRVIAEPINRAANAVRPDRDTPAYDRAIQRGLETHEILGRARDAVEHSAPGRFAAKVGNFVSGKGWGDEPRDPPIAEQGGAQRADGGTIWGMGGLGSTGDVGRNGPDAKQAPGRRPHPDPRLSDGEHSEGDESDVPEFRLQDPSLSPKFSGSPTRLDNELTRQTRRTPEPRADGGTIFGMAGRGADVDPGRDMDDPKMGVARRPHPDPALASYGHAQSDEDPHASYKTKDATFEGQWSDIRARWKEIDAMMARLRNAPQGGWKTG